MADDLISPIKPGSRLMAAQFGAWQTGQAEKEWRYPTGCRTAADIWHPLQRVFVAWATGRMKEDPMRRSNKPDPYNGFKNDEERRRALNVRSVCCAVVGIAMAAASNDWKALQWLMKLFP